MFKGRAGAVAGAVVVMFGLLAAPSGAQDAAAPRDQGGSAHDATHMDMPMDMEMPVSGWHLMQEGSLYLIFNHQGGGLGGDEVRAPNWWMGMAKRRVRRGNLTLTGMFSLDPATVGPRGYREIFQVGEALDGRPLIDRQHPHDFWMQLSASWRTEVTVGTGLTVAGGLSGEPALGPVAFMHRASALGIPLAPLGHHTFDSTHVAFGVATLGVDRGPLTVEASVFNGREPDQHRWNFDFGRLDSVSGRIWYRPTAAWALQVSIGRLVEPEQLVHGNIIRTTGSASYTRGDAAHLVAATVGIGMNAGDGVTRHAAFGEVSRGWGRTLGLLRLEVVEVESDLWLTGELPQVAASAPRRDPVGALTLGVQRDVATWKGLTAALGVNASAYAVPAILRASHGAHPGSFQVFLQVRPPLGAMGHMWNMRMAAP